MATPSSTKRKVPRPAANARVGPTGASWVQFRAWSPSRQKTWLGEMHRHRAAGTLSEEQLLNLTQCQAAFDAGL